MTSPSLRSSTLLRAVAVVAALGATGLSLSACNTAKGFGQDVKSAGTTTGNATSNAATDVQQKM